MYKIFGTLAIQNYVYAELTDFAVSLVDGAKDAVKSLTFFAITNAYNGSVKTVYASCRLLKYSFIGLKNLRIKYNNLKEIYALKKAKRMNQELPYKTATSNLK
jgi:hypothetical protein